MESRKFGLLEEKTLQLRPDTGGETFVFKIEIDEPSRKIRFLLDDGGFNKEQIFTGSSKLDNASWNSSLNKWN